MYVVTVNTPGYLSESEPIGFDSAAEAWDYVADEIERAAEDAPAEDEDAYWSAHRDAAYLAAGAWSLWSPRGEGAVAVSDRPSYMYDLGLVWSVDFDPSFTENSEGE